MSKKKKERQEQTATPATRGAMSRKGDVIFILLVLVGIAAFAIIISLSTQYSAELNRQAVLMAESYAEDANVRFVSQVNSFREKTAALAVAVASYEDRESLDAYLNEIVRSEGYRDVILSEIRYFQGDKEYSQRSGSEVAADEENVYVLDLRRKNALSTYGMVYDAKGTKPSLACYSPVEGSEVLDGILLYFPQETVLSFVSELDAERTEYADLQAVCCANNDSSAQVLAVIRDTSESVRVNDSFYGYLQERTNNSDMYRSVVGLMEGTETGSLLIDIQSVRYIASVGHANPTDAGVYVVSLYQAEKIYSEGYSLITTIITVMTILALVLLGYAVFFFVSGRRISARIEEINMVDPVLDCPTLLKFEKNVRELLDRNRSKKYVVVASHLQHYRYIHDTYGERALTDVLRHIKDSIYNSLRAEETYGYVSEGEFAFMLVFTSDKNLNDRLVALKDRFLALPKEIGLEDYRLLVSFGAYVLTPKDRTQPASQMVTKAMSVHSDASVMNVKQVFKTYTPVMENTLMRRAEIESRMEGALAAGEFRVFYQPKYNLMTEDIDGAELLVRWYDSERKRYRKPDEFLPVFEENGFITKLDRQVYYTACETFAEWMAKGRRVYPISVNVSRVTAIQEDFLNYYEAVKKKFNIPNDYITLEFTESFAYENYDHLGGIAQRLRTAGFLCSIDDFGTGASTFSTLQKLEMDEIKLDRFFIIDDPMSEKEKIILQNVIDLGKKLNMKVTQEGVETREYVRMLRKMGCEIIQGYYFAKPMGVEDYERFVDDFIATGRILGEEPE